MLLLLEGETWGDDDDDGGEVSVYVFTKLCVFFTEGDLIALLCES